MRIVQIVHRRNDTLQSTKITSASENKT